MYQFACPVSTSINGFQFTNVIVSFTPDEVVDSITATFTVDETHPPFPPVSFPVGDWTIAEDEYFTGYDMLNAVLVDAAGAVCYNTIEDWTYTNSTTIVARLESGRLRRELAKLLPPAL